MTPVPTLSPGGYAARILTCSLLWSSGFLFMKLAGAVHPVVLSASRASIATVVLAAWIALMGRSPVPAREERIPWLVLGTLNGWIPNILTAYAILHISTALSAMIQASGPLMTAVLAHLAFADERLTPRRMAGVLIGLAGMAVLIGPAALAGADGGAVGIACMVAVSLCYASGNIYTRTLRHLDPTRMALGQQTVSGAVSIVMAVVLFGSGAATQALSAPLPLLALGVLATAVPITVFMSLIRAAGPTRAAMIGYLLPVWASILAVVFLGERIGLREMAGAAIILCGVWIVSTAPRKP